MKLKWYWWVLIVILLLVLSYIIYKIMNPIRYFKYSEFDSPALKSDVDNPNIKTYKRGSRNYITGSGKKNMDKAMISRLDQARHGIEKRWNKKNKSNRIVFKINSGYRTPSYNATLKNSVPNSAHTKGHAVDITWSQYTLEQKKEIAKELYLAGFRRFGPANTFIHTDDDASKPQMVNWGYPNPIFNVFSLFA